MTADELLAYGKNSLGQIIMERVGNIAAPSARCAGCGNRLTYSNGLVLYAAADDGSRSKVVIVCRTATCVEATACLGLSAVSLHEYLLHLIHNLGVESFDDWLAFTLPAFPQAAATEEPPATEPPPAPVEPAASKAPVEKPPQQPDKDRLPGLYL